MHHTLNALLCVVILSLTACAANEPNKVVSAASTPLSDLNLVHAPIPETLVVAQQAPYALPASTDCTILTTEIRKLDEVLGADLDAPATDANPGLVERGVQGVGNAAVGAVQRTAEGVVPFRGWVRKLSGAERYSQRVAAAIAAGTVRRGFLKGIRAVQKCA